jgi:hypothetical protein
MHAWNIQMQNVNPHLSSDPRDPAVRTNRWNEGAGEGYISNRSRSNKRCTQTHTAAVVFLTESTSCNCLSSLSSIDVH